MHDATTYLHARTWTRTTRGLAPRPAGAVGVRWAPAGPARPRRRPGRDPGPAGRAADARLRDDPGAGDAHRRRLAAEPGVGLSHPAAARGRGPDPRGGGRGRPPVHAH